MLFILVCIYTSIYVYIIILYVIYYIRLCLKNIYLVPNEIYLIGIISIIID